MTGADAAASGDGAGRLAELGDNDMVFGVSVRRRATQWDVMERPRRAGGRQSPECIDLTEQTPPPRTPVGSDVDRVTDSADTDTGMRSAAPGHESLRASHQRLSGSDSADELRHYSRSGVTGRSRRHRSSSSRSRSPGRRRKWRRSSRSREYRSRRQSSQSIDRRCSGYRAGSGRRDSSADHQRSASAAVDGTMTQAQSGERPQGVLGHERCPDSRQPQGRAAAQQHRAVAVHNLAATELRRLREQALVALSGIQSSAISAQDADGEDRWVME